MPDMDTISPRPVSVPTTIDLSSRASVDQLNCQGFAPPEPHGRWTNGHDATLGFTIDPACNRDVLLTLELAGFLQPTTLPEQRVAIGVNGVSCGVWSIREPGWHARPIILPVLERERDGLISLSFAIPTCLAPATLGISPDTRALGIIIRRLLFGTMPRA